MPTPLRAALLASWGSAFLAGSVALEKAVRAVEGDDEPHLVVEGFAPPDELAGALPELRAQGVLALRLALPAPGDLLGLTGPAELNRAAMAAGEAVIGVLAAQSGPDATVPALVPEVSAFGSPGDMGHCVTWRRANASSVTPDVPGLAQADRDLAHAMREATAALSSVTLSSWASDAATVAQRLRGHPRPLLLPDVADPRAEALAQRSLRVAAIVEAARADDGGALTAHSAQVRAGALAPLDRAARRGLVAAVSACHDMVAR